MSHHHGGSYSRIQYLINNSEPLIPIADLRSACVAAVIPTRDSAIVGVVGGDIAVGSTIVQSKHWLIKIMGTLYRYSTVLSVCVVPLIMELCGWSLCWKLTFGYCIFGLNLLQKFLSSVEERPLYTTASCDSIPLFRAWICWFPLQWVHSWYCVYPWNFNLRWKMGLMYRYIVQVSILHASILY